MSSVEPNTASTSGQKPAIPRKKAKVRPPGWIPAVIVMGLMVLVAVIVVLNGRPAAEVGVVIGPLTPLAVMAMSRRGRGKGDQPS